MSPNLEYGIRIAAEADAASASALVHASFSLAAGDWTLAARQRFLDIESSAERLQRRIPEAAFAAVAVTKDEVVGFVLMQSPCVLDMLFVHPDWLRRGVGRALWEAARTHIEQAFPDVRTIELNSTPYAVAAYRSMGFVPVSAEFERGGCRAIRMACRLPARALNAERR